MKCLDAENRSLKNMSVLSSFMSLQTQKREISKEQDDIESNLLVPAGVTMRWATLSLKVYRAEDVPQSKSPTNS